MTTTMENLPPEVLLIVFSHYIETEGHTKFMRNIVPVCKTWQNISSTSSLWKSVDIRNLNGALSLAHRGLLKHTQNLKLPNDDSGVVSPPKVLDSFSVLSCIRNLKSLEILNNNNINKINTMFVALNCPNLEHLRMKNVRAKDIPIRLGDVDPILTELGPKLKHLSFRFCEIQDSEQFITEISAKCLALEELEWCNYGHQFPIYKLSCSRLQKLYLHGSGFDTMTGGNDYSTFKALTTFKAVECNCHGLHIKTILKNSENLEHLELDWNDDLIITDISMIPSDKVKVLKIWVKKNNGNLVALEQAVIKWKLTLVDLKILGLKCNITSILESYLESNQCPKLEVLCVEKASVDLSFLKIFVEKCRNLKELKFQDTEECFRSRESVVNF